MGDNVKFADLVAISGTLLDHVLQTIKRYEPELHDALISRHLKHGMLNLEDGVGERIDEFFEEHEAQQEEMRRVRIGAEGVKFEKEFKAKQDAELQKAIDLQLAKNRVEEYAAQQNLERTPQNVEKIAAWIDSTCGGVWNPGNVDAAIKVLHRQLVWATKATPPPPKPQPIVWSPGQPLPPNATEEMLKAAPLADVKAWVKAKR